MFIARYLFLLLFSSTLLLGGQSQKERIHYTGDMRADMLMNNFQKDTVVMTEIGGGKSPYIASLASALLPGAGQAYAGNWWMAAGFFVAEAVGVTASLYYSNMGYQQTVFFQNYADWNISSAPGKYTARWDVVKYAEWVNSYVEQNLGDKSPINIDPNQSLPPWDRVNWSELNAKEMEILKSNTSSGFSHTLPPYGSQSYYEEIGKYPQFGHGWDDANAAFAGTEIVTNHLTYYAGQRYEANQLYLTGTLAVVLVMLNHFTSAIDAAILANPAGQTLTFGMSKETLADGSVDFAPQMTLTVGF
ncbi:MAG TPA: hypothetical protein VFA55_03970 [Candidatus Kapabacteria bacterium]|nr:hypothetical protein [Candidatus Kapabacteria bacterium]